MDAGAILQPNAITKVYIYIYIIHSTVPMNIPSLLHLLVSPENKMIFFFMDIYIYAE